MGDYFKDKPMEEHPIKEAREKILTDPNQIAYEYNALMMRFKEVTDVSYKRTMPLREELFGAKNRPNSRGKVHLMLTQIEHSPLRRMTVGSDMENILNKIDELDQSVETYVAYIEKILDGFIIISNSSIRLLAEKDKEVAALKSRMIELEDNLKDSTESPPIIAVQSEKLITNKDRFLQELDRRIEMLKKYHALAPISKTPEQLNMMKTHLRNLARGNPDKLRIIEEEMIKVEGVA